MGNNQVTAEHPVHVINNQTKRRYGSLKYQKPKRILSKQMSGILSYDNIPECNFAQIFKSIYEQKEFEFFSLPNDIKKEVLVYLEHRDFLHLRLVNLDFKNIIDTFCIQLNIPVRFLALQQVRNVKKFERMKSSTLWKESKEFIDLKYRQVDRLGLRFHSFGNLNEKWMRQSGIPKNLHHLWIQSCKIGAETISNLPSQLKQLVIKDCKLFSDSHLLLLPSALQLLVIFKCPNISDQGVINISQSPCRTSLHHLDLTCNNNLTNIIFSHLPPNLQVLELSSCKQLCDEGIKADSLPRSLKSLSVNCIENMGSNLFKVLPPNLIYLDLVHTTAKLSSQMKSSLPKTIQEIRLCSCNGISKESLDYLPSNLNRLSLMHCKNLTPDIIDSLPQKLKTLSLYGSASDEILKKLPTNLTELDLAASKAVTDEGIKNLKDYKLKILRLDETKITSSSFHLFPKTLQELSISKCDNIESADFDSLPPQLFKMTALECPSLCAKGISKLKKQRRNLIVTTSYSVTREILQTKFNEEEKLKKKKK